MRCHLHFSLGDRRWFLRNRSKMIEPHKVDLKCLRRPFRLNFLVSDADVRRVIEKHWVTHSLPVSLSLCRGSPRLRTSVTHGTALNGDLTKEQSESARRVHTTQEWRKTFSFKNKLKNKWVDLLRSVLLNWHFFVFEASSNHLNPKTKARYNLLFHEYVLKNWNIIKNK